MKNLMLIKLAVAVLFCAVTLVTGYEASAQMSGRQAYVQCRAQAIVADVSGEAYAAYIERCMAAPGAAATTSAQGQFASCQSQARATGGSGEAYGRNLDLCMNASASGAPSGQRKSFVECRTEARGAIPQRRCAAELHERLCNPVIPLG
jgi:hypothetical protein